MLLACKKARPKSYERWQRVLWGLWHTGFRVGELMQLHWSDEPVTIDFSEEWPGFRFRPEGQKNKKDQWVPMTPDFHAMFVAPVPESQREGFLFPFRRVSKVIDSVIAIGKESGVVVGRRKDNSPRTPSSKDVGRRAFATRYRAALGDTARTLLRHADVKTTDLYDGGQALVVARNLWDGR